VAVVPEEPRTSTDAVSWVGSWEGVPGASHRWAHIPGPWMSCKVHLECAGCGCCSGCADGAVPNGQGSAGWHASHFR
jgi:hypothetical protein